MGPGNCCIAYKLGYLLNWMPGTKTVLDFEAPNDKASNAIAEADWIFALILIRLAVQKNGGKTDSCKRPKDFN
ncbi:MAG: hypothetical protein WDM90_10645 [Ferruginibacter sp.]